VILKCTNSEIKMLVGKPSTYAFQVLQSSHCATVAENCVMVGDQIPTDILFGRNCGMATILTLTGISNSEMVNRSDIKPDFVVDSLSCLMFDSS